MNDYFEGYDEIGLFVLDQFEEITNPIELTELKQEAGFNPPQSFVALSHRASGFLDKRMGKINAKAH